MMMAKAAKQQTERTNKQTTDEEDKKPFVKFTFHIWWLNTWSHFVFDFLKTAFGMKV